MSAVEVQEYPQILVTANPHPQRCPSSRWCHPAISFSVIPFSSHLQYFPASGSYQMSQFFSSGGQIIGASASVLPMNIQHWFPLGWTGWISLQSKGPSRVFSNTTIQKHQFFGAQLPLWLDWFDLLAVQGTLKRLLQHHSSKASILWRSASFMVQLSHDYWKNCSFDCGPLLANWYLCFFNTLTGFVVTFLPRIKHLWISWLQSLHATETLESRK